MSEAPQGQPVSGHPSDYYDSHLDFTLRAYRKREAKNRGISRYQVFHDKTLQDLIETKPRYPEDLADIYRFGPKTIGAHGKEVLQTIDRWADVRWDEKEQVGPKLYSFDATVFESTLGNSSWTKILSQLYLSFSHGRPRVTSKDLVERSGCSEETVRRTLVEMEETGMILRGGRGEGHTLNWKLARIENLILSLDRIEGKRKRKDILHLIRHLKVKDSKHREDEITAGLLKLLDGDPASLDGFLESSLYAGAWAEERLSGALGGTNLDYTSLVDLSPITEDGENVRRGLRKVDATVRLSRGELLCIEAHLPLHEFRNIVDHRDAQFFGRMKYRIRELGRRFVVDEDEKKKREQMNEEYIPEYEKYGTADYCIIYIPSEEIFSYISSNQPDILDWSIRDHRVLLTSPRSLLPTLKLLEILSQNEGIIRRELMDNILGNLDVQRGAYLLESMKALGPEIQKVILDYEKSIFANRVTYKGEHEDQQKQEMAKHRMASQESQIIILQALVELHEKKKSKYIPRSELRAEAKTLGLERSNSRFSQILSSLEEDGLIARKSLGDVELGSIGVTLKPKSQYESYIPNSWKIRIAELFDDEGKFHFES